MKTFAPINIVMHYPTTEEGMLELKRRAAEVHADFVNATLKKLNCPTSQKLELLEAVIETVKSSQERVDPRMR